eukprot:TRINITY_DN3880_c0_g2_i1.p3 TRINITY_DN3880_c0_g2~~TRINITY_DN3880_c0_g2_i1.p3  ORF type:complete len:145 (-),score=8.08 TRINITY_DN3880_c0_g2_i1:192-626(-)
MPVIRCLNWQGMKCTFYKTNVRMRKRQRRLVSLQADSGFSSKPGYTSNDFLSEQIPYRQGAQQRSGNMLVVLSTVGNFLRELFLDAWKMAPWQKDMPKINVLNFKDLIGRVALVVVALFVLLVLVSTVDSILIVIMYKLIRKVA